jgi:hypothetical protein
MEPFPYRSTEQREQSVIPINNTTPHLQNIGENKILHGCIVDTDRPTPDLHTI